MNVENVTKKSDIRKVYETKTYKKVTKKRTIAY